MIRLLASLHGLHPVRAASDAAARADRLRGQFRSLEWRPPPVRAVRAATTWPGSAWLLALAGAALAWGGVSMGAGLAGLLTAPAIAQTPPDLLGRPDAETTLLLDFLHGVAEGRSAGLADMLRVFSGAVLAYAGLLVVWRLVEAVVDTAREGRSGIGGWDAIRLAAAIALLAPTPATGLGVGQHLVLALSDVGGRAATAIWEPFASSTLVEGELPAPVRLPPSFRPALGGAVLAEICANILNAEARAANDPALVNRRVREVGDVLRVGYDGARSPVPRGGCGEIEIPLPEGDAASRAAAQAHQDAYAAVVPDIRALGRLLSTRNILGHANYGQAIQGVPAAAAAIEARYRAVAEEGLADAAAAARTARPANAGAAIRSEGWLAAATYFNLIFQSNVALLAAAAGAPSATHPSGDLAKWSAGAAASVAHGARLLETTALAAAPPTLIAAAASGGGTLLGRVFSFADVGAIRIIDSGAPLADLASLGQTMINTVVSAITALTAAATGSGVAQSIPLIGRGLDAFGHAWRVMDGFVTTALTLLALIGGVLGYLVPLIPFMRFLFGIVAWVLDIVEAIAAVPLWLTAHIARERSQLIPGRAQGGWLLLLGIVVRPPLMILGLILGYLAFAAGVRLVNRLWLAGITSAEGTPTVSPLSWMVYLVIYTLIVWGLVNLAFQTIDRLPAAILRWIGAPSGTAAESGGTQGTIVSAAGRAATMTAGAVGRLGRMAGRFR